MIRVSRFLAAAAVACQSAACASAHLPVVTRLTAGQPPATSGVVYWLPKADIEVLVDVQRLSIQSGRCAGAKAVARSIGLRDEDLRPTTTAVFSLKRHDLVSRLTRDPDQVFLVSLQTRKFNAMASELVLTDRGLLSRASFDGENVLPRAVSEVISLVAGSLRAVSRVSSEPAAETDNGFCQSVADEIASVRAQRREMLRNSTADAAATQFRNDELRRIEAGLLQHFTGYERLTIGQINCVAKVTSQPGQSVNLLRFDTEAGVSSADESCLVPPPFQNTGTAVGEDLALVLQREGDGLWKESGPPSGDPGGRGLYYRLPGVAQATLKHGSRVLGVTSLPIPQLGALARLPGGDDLDFGRAALAADFGQSGNLEQLKLTGRPVDIGPVTQALQSGVVDVAAGIQERRVASDKAEAAAAAANDELLLLERRRKVLEEIKRIQDLEKALGVESVTKPPTDGLR